jgi:hypothetical protein
MMKRCFIRAWLLSKLLPYIAARKASLAGHPWHIVADLCSTCIEHVSVVIIYEPCCSFNVTCTN